MAMSFGAGRAVATGHPNYEQRLEVGDRVEIGGQHGIVTTIEPLLEIA
jgi:preprotein translocase subunit YajC